MTTASEIVKSLHRNRKAHGATMLAIGETRIRIDALKAELVVIDHRLTSMRRICSGCGQQFDSERKKLFCSTACNRSSYGKKPEVKQRQHDLYVMRKLRRS